MGDAVVRHGSSGHFALADRSLPTGTPEIRWFLPDKDCDGNSLHDACEITR